MSLFLTSAMNQKILYSRRNLTDKIMHTTISNSPKLAMLGNSMSHITTNARLIEKTIIFRTVSEPVKQLATIQSVSAMTTITGHSTRFVNVPITTDKDKQTSMIAKKQTKTQPKMPLVRTTSRQTKTVPAIQNGGSDSGVSGDGSGDGNDDRGDGSGDGVYGSGDGVHGSGDGVHGSGDGVHGSGDIIQDSGDGVHGSGDGVHGSGDGIHGSGDGVHSSDDGVHGSGDGVHGSGDGVHGSGDGVLGSGDGFHGSGVGVHGSGDVIQENGDGVHGSGDGVHGSGDGVHGSGDVLHGSGDGVHGSGGSVHGSGGTGNDLGDGDHGSTDGNTTISERALLSLFLTSAMSQKILYSRRNLTDIIMHTTISNSPKLAMLGNSLSPITTNAMLTESTIIFHTVSESEKQLATMQSVPAMTTITGPSTKIVKIPISTDKRNQTSVIANTQIKTQPNMPLTRTLSHLTKTVPAIQNILPTKASSESATSLKTMDVKSSIFNALGPITTSAVASRPTATKGTADLSCSKIAPTKSPRIDMLGSSIYMYTISQKSKTNTSKLDKQLNSEPGGYLTYTKKVVIATIISVVGVAGITVISILFYVGFLRKCLER